MRIFLDYLVMIMHSELKFSCLFVEDNFMLDEKDLLTANFNFDYETKFSDLGINIDASFSTASSTATHIYGDDTGRSGFTDLSDFTISSESLTNLLSNNSKTL